LAVDNPIEACLVTVLGRRVLERIAEPMQNIASARGRVQNKRALITGAASGIGRATALLLAREGARVLATDLDAARVQATTELIRQAGGQSIATQLDVTAERDWQAAIHTITLAWGGLDILVANAGVSLARPVTEMTLEEWRGVMAVNLDGVFLGTKHAVRAMRQSQGGSIVIVSSASGMKASPGASAYAASKAALRLFAKSVALECAQQGDGIRVNTVHPAGVETEMWKSTPFWQQLAEQSGSEQEAWSTLAVSSPLKRFATPDEIGYGILYLASDEAAYVTGSELVIDGGFTA
jgi:3(or 17)beta-hydroxysteroid dehydrogenase